MTAPTASVRTAGDLVGRDFGGPVTVTTAHGDTVAGRWVGTRILICGDYLLQLEGPQKRRDWYRVHPDAQVVTP